MTSFCDTPCLTAQNAAPCQVRRCLIRHSARGDSVAIELLFERVYTAVYRQAAHLCQGRDESQDLAQETLALAFQGLGKLKEPRHLMPWLAAIARNRLRERHRKSKFAPPALDEFSDGLHLAIPCSPDSPIDRLIVRETAESLARAARALPPLLNQAFQLRVLEQLSTRDCAARLGITEMCVRTRLSRARHLLRTALNPQSEPSP
ncbi:RNA polymerase sigma factor [Paludibaculum fermentans]|uniref:RNA polymerase sigma factor n=1 Tax=Paludibaculum fermentans TaxID=1473598 RepID=UPI003EBF16B2